MEYIGQRGYISWLKSRSSYDCKTVYECIDYAYKATIPDDLCKAISYINYMAYIIAIGDDSYSHDEIYSLKNTFDDLVQKYGLFQIIEANKMNNARWHRIKRLTNKITSLMDKSCLFCTFTFTNEFVDDDPKLLRDRVVRYMKKFSTDFVGNVDYGKKNERIHFHAVVQADSLPFSEWKYGNLDVERVINNPDKIAKYINKLVHHAIKETTRRNSLIYCRK